MTLPDPTFPEPRFPEARQVLAVLDDPAALLRGGRVVASNDALRTLLGGDDLEGRAVDELDAPPGLELRVRAIDEIWSLCTFARPPGLDAWLGQIPDEAVATLLLAHRQDPVSLIDPASGRFVDVSDAWCRQYGWSREEAVGRMGPSDVSAEPEKTASAVAARARGETGGDSSLRWHRRRDGSVFPVELQCGTLDVRGKKLVYARLRDVEERIRAEDALRRSESRFRELIEQLPMAVVVHRAAPVLYANPHARRLFGFGLEEDLSEVAVLDLVHPDDRGRVRSRIEEFGRTGMSAPMDEERLVRRDGTVVVAEVIGWPLHFEGEPAVLVVAQDVTERKSLETQLVMADRLASLGRLAASVGHEINNPLAYVMGSLEVLRRDAEDLDEALRYALVRSIDAAEHGALRVRDIVRDLKALSRGDDTDGGPAELGRTLDACVQMASHELRHRARVERDYERGVWVTGSEGRLGQLFLNLLVNAAQAIDEGARSQNQVRIAAWIEGDLAVVEISDTGRGLPGIEGDRIFEPFFTTKRGTGTGLGLSICHHIARSLGGTIEAEARAPRGTTFRVRLPIASSPGRASAPPLESVEVQVEPDRRVLVVEDEPPIRDLLESWLEGYDVVTAKSGREALEQVAAQGPFDVIVCDLMMDDLTGMDVHARLAERHSGQEERMIFTTGGAFTPRARAFLDEVRGPRLDKPFRRSEVLTLVRSMLDGPDATRAQPGGVGSPGGLEKPGGLDQPGGTGSPLQIGAEPPATNDKTASPSSQTR